MAPGASRSPISRLWASPAAFAVTFAVGFFITFVPGALLKLRSPDVRELLADNRANEAVAILEEREKAGEVAKGDWVVYGHAILAYYGTIRRDEMLKKYGHAVAEKRVDATALDNTIAALAELSVQDRAIDVLKEWPEDAGDPNGRLQARLGDENTILRHGALNAMVARKLDKPVITMARARVAIADIKARACNETKDGVFELKRLADEEKAGSTLKALSAQDALVELLDRAELAKVECLKEKDVRQATNAVAAAIGGQ